MKKTIMMLAAMAFVFGMASCGDDDDDNAVDYGQAVAGTYAGQTGADFGAGGMSFTNYVPTTGESSSVAVTKVSNNTANVTYTSDVWGNATFNNATITENDTAYVFSSVKSQISMTQPGNHEGAGTTSNYDATFSGYVLKDGGSDRLKVTIVTVLGGMGEVTLHFNSSSVTK